MVSNIHVHYLGDIQIAVSNREYRCKYDNNIESATLQIVTDTDSAGMS